MTRELFFVVLVSEEPERGPVVEASSAGEALDIVHGTVARADAARRGELHVWTERYYRERCLEGGPMPCGREVP